jgi:hypothetical protein
MRAKEHGCLLQEKRRLESSPLIRGTLFTKTASYAGKTYPHDVVARLKHIDLKLADVNMKSFK